MQEQLFQNLVYALGEKEFSLTNPQGCEGAEGPLLML